MGDVAAGISFRQVEVIGWPEICLAVGREFLVASRRNGAYAPQHPTYEVGDVLRQGIVRNKKFGVMKWCTELAGLMPGEHNNG